MSIDNIFIYTFPQGGNESMKKVVIACLLAILMLMIPVTANAVTIDLDKKDKMMLFNEEEPKIFITKEQKNTLVNYVEDNFEGEEITQANEIIDSIFTYDPEYEIFNVNVDTLVQAVDDYAYYHIIPQDTIDNVQSKAELNQLIATTWDFSNYPFADLMNKIIELIKGRLGWLYELFSLSSGLFVDGVDLAKDFIYVLQNLNVAILVATVVNLLVTIPVYYFAQSLKKLFNLDLEGFVDIISEFVETFTGDLSNLIDIVEDILILLGEFFEPLLEYIRQVGDFIDWITAPVRPWEKEIELSGTATNLFGNPIVGAEVSCNGETVVTDSNGKYEFSVQPTGASADSIPPNNYYGLHTCIITISRNGKEIKNTPKLLSYVCSGGSISWSFFIIKGKSLDTNTLFQQRIEVFMDKIRSIFPNFF